MGSGIHWKFSINGFLHECAGNLKRLKRSLIFDSIIQLSGTEEYIDGENAGQLGDVVIRCNNVLYIRGQNLPADQTMEQSKHLHMPTLFWTKNI